MFIASLLIDFDGTACPFDVSEELLDEFGHGDWRALDEAVDRGELGLREAAEAQAAMLHTTREQMLAFALDRFTLDETFPPFVAWAEARGLPLAVISDGFGFYVRPILERAGLGDVEVMTNDYVDGALVHPFAHPVCVGCGTCKMQAAVRFRDRYGALYSDLVFAKKELVRICTEDGVPYLDWETFHDVRASLESTAEAPGPVSPERCPGWRLA